MKRVGLEQILMVATDMDDWANRQPNDALAKFDQDEAWWHERGYVGADVYLYSCNLAEAVQDIYGLDEHQLGGMGNGILCGLRLGVEIERRRGAVE